MTENIKYPGTYIDAKEMLENTLNLNMKLLLRAYEGLFSNVCSVSHYSIKELDNPEELEGYSNLDLNITYKQNIIEQNGDFKQVERTRDLKLLSPHGDTHWTYRLIDKIWEGDYPSTVAIDINTKEVFFLNIRMTSLELIEFGNLNELEFEAFMHEVNDHQPYRVRIAEDAMMDYIDGGEGLSYLKKNIQIQLNCSVPITIHLGGNKPFAPLDQLENEQANNNEDTDVTPEG